MVALPPIIQARQTNSRERLERLSVDLAAISVLNEMPGLCLYVTGSFGRLEASPHSDLDLFFVWDDAGASSLSRIRKTLLDAELIRLCRNRGFPEFSADGKFLEVHSAKAMRENLGSPDDDAKNTFTARLLLILESRPVHNSTAYQAVLRSVVDAYYRDYHEHEKDFLPVFMVNDILRYWKTLCLNYEHRRERGTEQGMKRNKSHLRNLKMKFSRLLTCFSTVLFLTKNHGVIQPDQLLEFTCRTPLERLALVAEDSSRLTGMLDEYAWFLEHTGQAESEVLAWIANQPDRDDAFERARRFGANMFDLLQEVSGTTKSWRYLVI